MSRRGALLIVATAAAQLMTGITEVSAWGTRHQPLPRPLRPRCQQQHQHQQHQQPRQRLAPRFAESSDDGEAGGKKGFGKAPPPSKKKKGKKGGGAPTPIELGGPASAQPLRLASEADEDFPEVSDRAVKALAEMEQRSQSRGDDVQRKIDDLEEVQKVLVDNPTAGVIPDVVAKRMLFRMLPLAAVPIFGGIALFVFFYLGATKGDFEVPPTIVAYATTAPWLLGLAGLTYGLISTSWDEDVEGSFLGFDEFQTNVGRIVDGVRRGGENEELREIQSQQNQKDRK